MGISPPYKKELYIRTSLQPPRFDNETITISSTDSSPRSGLANPSIDLAIDYERAVLLDVNQIHLYVGTLNVHDGEGLLPVKRARRTAVERLTEIHEVSYLNPM